MLATDNYELVDTYKDYKYAVYFNDVLGYRCGYVKIPETHPLFEIPFTEVNLESVQLTFSGHIKSLSGWYIGWDHHHLWDGIDEEGIIKAHPDLPKEDLYKMIEYARSYCSDYGYISYASDVENECHNVINELIRRNKNDSD